MLQLSISSVDDRSTVDFFIRNDNCDADMSINEGICHSIVNGLVHLCTDGGPSRGGIQRFDNCSTFGFSPCE
jgi:hypothetical protein